MVYFVVILMKNLSCRLNSAIYERFDKYIDNELRKEKA